VFSKKKKERDRERGGVEALYIWCQIEKLNRKKSNINNGKKKKKKKKKKKNQRITMLADNTIKTQIKERWRYITPHSLSFISLFHTQSHLLVQMFLLCLFRATWHRKHR
jgi:hypothetical protein